MNTGSQPPATVAAEHLSVFLERTAGEGEDSDPLIITDNRQAGILAVFDGMGGSGGARYTSADGKTNTGAYRASRLAKSVVVNHFDKLKERLMNPLGGPLILDAQSLVGDLRTALSKEFAARIAELDTTTSKLKSNLLRRLPTTMATVYYEKVVGQAAPGAKPTHWESLTLPFRPDRAHYRCLTVWAGDSRAYLLRSSFGLQQLTRDDLKSKGDALANLVEDSPLSNCIHADGDFFLRWNSLTIDLPAILLVATDGCFGYLSTPAHFEFLLLSTLEESANMSDWKQRLTSEFERIAGDDVSLALSSLGWTGFSELKRDFSERTKFIRDKYVSPVNALESQITIFDEQIAQFSLQRARMLEERQLLRSRLWDDYKPTYEALGRNDQRTI